MERYSIPSRCCWKYPLSINLQKWNQYEILQDAWKKLFEKYKTSRLSKDATHFTNLYTDTTMIKNWLGETAQEVIQQTEEEKTCNKSINNY
jgi:hypothetical protein